MIVSKVNGKQTIINNEINADRTIDRKSTLIHKTSLQQQPE